MSLTTAVRSLRRTYLKKFPGASDADLNVFLKYVFEAAAANPKATYKDEEAVASAEKTLAEAADRGEAWAVNLRDAVLINVVKPIVDKAESKGVDPVTALVLEDFSDEQAREYVAALASRSGDLDTSADADEADEDGVDSFAQPDSDSVSSAV